MAASSPPTNGTLPRLEREEIVLHGHGVSYRQAGQGPVLMLIHGITGSWRHWERVIAPLAKSFTVIAPDLRGHGDSAKPRGDYSLGAFASGLRDLMIALDHTEATVVGHSLGGGIAMQFAYQFPERCERLVLVSSGGLGTEVHPLLRAGTLPGSEFVLPLLSHDRLREGATRISGALGRVGLDVGSDVAEIARGIGSLHDPETRHAFLETLRAVIGPMGQKIDASDRLYLAESMPALIVWGRRDPVIPIEHGEGAHEAMPGSRFEVFEDAGHFPQLDDPYRFAEVLAGFVEETAPARIDAEELRERVLAGASA